MSTNASAGCDTACSQVNGLPGACGTRQYSRTVSTPGIPSGKTSTSSSPIDRDPQRVHSTFTPT